LFYLQYENREDARIYAEEISKKANADNRIQNLSNQILCDAKSDPEFKDNMIKNSIRILKRIISKYIFNNKAQTDQLIKFSDKINSDWWNEY
jgi:molecular chaperone DnaK (HSP70)